MSTSYSELKAPWTSIRVERRGTHFETSFWVNGQLAGHILLREGEVSDAVHSLTGARVGTISSLKEGPSLTTFKDPRTDCVISEYGEIKSWKDIVTSHQGR